MDWIFLDMTITGELCAYGESIKQSRVARTSNGLDLNMRYYKAKGNLQALNTTDWNVTFERLNMWFWFAIAFPVAGIWAAFHFGFEQVGRWFLAIYVILWSLDFLNRITSFIRGTSGGRNPKLQALQQVGSSCGAKCTRYGGF
jgi:hypothetical protein